MNIKNFNEQYKNFRNNDLIEIACDHPEHDGHLISIKKYLAIKNIAKNGEFICWQCFYKDLKKHECRDELIDVICPHPDHKGEKSRQLRKSSFFGLPEEPFTQMCNKCCQRGKIISEEQKEKLRKSTIEQYKNGFFPKRYHCTGWHESLKAGEVFFRSSYEKKAYTNLDEDITVKSYTTESVTVTYWHPVKKINSSHIIDLLVEYADGSKKLIEVKPERWLKDETIKAKIEAGKIKAKEMNIAYEVWSEIDIFGDNNGKAIRSYVKSLRK